MHFHLILPVRNNLAFSGSRIIHRASAAWFWFPPTPPATVKLRPLSLSSENQSHFYLPQQLFTKALPLINAFVSFLFITIPHFPGALNERTNLPDNIASFALYINKQLPNPAGGVGTILIQSILGIPFQSRMCFNEIYLNRKKQYKGCVFGTIAPLE